MGLWFIGIGAGRKIARPMLLTVVRVVAYWDAVSDPRKYRERKSCTLSET
jgi:hypothetical protein